MPVADLTARRLQARLATEQVRGRLPSVVAAVTRDGVLQWRGSHGDHTGSAAAAARPAVPHRLDHQDDDRGAGDAAA